LEVEPAARRGEEAEEGPPGSELTIQFNFKLSLI
jgi:hypothetical protein